MIRDDETKLKLDRSNNNNVNGINEVVFYTFQKYFL